jgi:hypothetical protein
MEVKNRLSCVFSCVDDQTIARLSNPFVESDLLRDAEQVPDKRLVCRDDGI